MNNRTSLLRGIALILSLSAIATTGCKEEVQQKAPVVRPIKMMAVGDSSAGGKLEFPGRIKAASEATLSFEVDGKLEKLLVAEGDRVVKGAPLAQLDDRDYRSRYQEVLAEQKEAKARYDRAKELFANDSISKQDLDVDRRTFEVAVARLQTAKKGVEDAVLRAPFDGIVAKRYVENFEQVRAKQDILFFHADGGLEVKIDIPERIVRRYGGTSQREESENQATARFKPIVLVEGIDKPIEASFAEISSAADKVTRTFEIKLAFEKPEGAVILPGMSAKAIIHLAGAEEGSPVRIPARAVVAMPDKSPSVFVVKKKEDGTMSVMRTPVKVSKLIGEEVDVLEGLSTGDVVALSGLGELRDGKVVTKYSREEKK